MTLSPRPSLLVACRILSNISQEIVTAVPEHTANPMYKTSNAAAIASVGTRERRMTC